ncbi:MAG: shikimate dehydrogenase family protein [Beutenbergiaceae bacterium]
MRTVALFGMPLKRQHSVIMHNAAFASADIDARYELREVTEPELVEQVQQARRENWMGFQITAPHKQVVMQLLDVVEPAAEAIGAVNSVENRDGQLIGFNTDVLGFMAGLAGVTDPDLSGKSVVLAGSGGVAHAAAHGLASAGAERIAVLDLDLESPQRLTQRFAGMTAWEPLRLDDPAAAERLRDADVFVNATSVGMLTPGPVIDVNLLSEGTAVFDVVYIPAQTELVRQARARGLAAANGDAMLVEQAATAWTRWTGVPAPVDVMRQAVAPLLDDPDLQP